MVMILSQSRDSQGADCVTCRTFASELVRARGLCFSSEARCPARAVDGAHRPHRLRPECPRAALCSLWDVATGAGVAQGNPKPG